MSATSPPSYALLRCSIAVLGPLLQIEPRLASRGSALKSAMLAASALTLALTSCISDRSGSTEAADLILHHGVIHTMDDARHVATAIAVRGKQIIAVGDDTLAQTLNGPNTQQVDLKGALVLPGFIDAHVHPIMGGVELGQCSLNAARTVDALKAAIAACVAAKPQGWIVGGGWDLSLFKDGNPSKKLLDELAGQRPVFLTGADGHSAWANSAALQVAGIDAHTANPPGGIIERDAQGEPSGTLRETAGSLVSQHAPPIGDAERRVGLRRALSLATSLGITGMVEAAADADLITTYRAALSQNELPVRLTISVRIDPEHSEVAATLIEPATRGDPYLSIDAAKIFVDGVLEGETAALIEPYADGAHGRLNATPAQLNAAVTLLDARGAQVHMHAIGDGAVRAALDAVADARAHNGSNDNRHHIAHLQLIDPEDYGRFADLNVTANFQSLWAFPDGYITGINLPQVGQARVDRMYPAASISRAGGRIAGGSDWNVSSMNPLDAIEVAVTRMDPSGEGTLVLNPNERLTVDQAVAAYTRNAAYLTHREALNGTLEVGKRADLVVLSQDLFSIQASEINDTYVQRTYFDGRLVYERPQAPPIGSP